MLCLDAQSCSILCNSMDCVACQAPLSMGYSRQEYWSGLSWPPPGDLSNPGVKPGSPGMAGRFFTTMGNPGRSLLLLLLSHFSHVRLCVTPWKAAHQAPQSLGFSRQEHWSGLPFPSPMHESEKWKGSRSVVSDSSRPHGPQPTRLLRPWDFPGKSIGVGCHHLLHGNNLGKWKKKNG